MIAPCYHPELAARAVAGITASGLSALSIYYLMQGLPPAMRVGGLVISLGLSQIAFPLTRALSPALLVDGDMSRVFQFQIALSLIGFGLVYLLRLPPAIRKQTFEKLDIPSIALFVVGVAALCAFLIRAASSGGTRRGSAMRWLSPSSVWAAAS